MIKSPNFFFFSHSSPLNQNTQYQTMEEENNVFCFPCQVDNNIQTQQQFHNHTFISPKNSVRSNPFVCLFFSFQKFNLSSFCKNVFKFYETMFCCCSSFDREKELQVQHQRGRLMPRFYSYVFIINQFNLKFEVFFFSLLGSESNYLS